MYKILLVDDDPQGLESTRKILEMAGYEVDTACNGQDALEKVRGQAVSIEVASSRYDLVITDVRMPKLGGLEFLRAISLCGETLPVILMTAFGKVEDAVWAMKFGAVDFLTKPFKRQALISAVESALKRSKARERDGQELETESVSLSEQQRQLVGSSEAMQRLRGLISQVAPTAATILIHGESGSGKERVASSIHAQSARARGPFVAINCAAVPEQLIESELFGFEKGAFSGASSSKIGLFEAASGGTLLLDEIGDMPLSVQVKLLRVLQEGEVRRIGSTSSRKVDVRVIGATHRDLKAAVQVGAFRQDLLFRLEVIGLQVPPLRERLEDVPELARHLLKLACERHGKKIARISEEAIEILRRHSWPGNVRELSNVIERAIVFASGDAIMPVDLPPHLTQLEAAPSETISVRVGTPLRDVEDLLIRKTLEATSGDKNMTAKLLGINSRTIYRKLDKRLEREQEGE